jgi:hypothetical protein
MGISSPTDLHGARCGSISSVHSACTICGLARPYNVDSRGKSPSKPFKAQSRSGFLEIVRAVRKPAGFGVCVMRSGRRFYFVRFRKGGDFARRPRTAAPEICRILPACAESDGQAPRGRLTLRANSRLVTKATICGRHVEIGILGTSAADGRTRHNCGASIFRRRRFRIPRLFYRSRCCQPPCHASAQGHRAQIWSHQRIGAGSPLVLPLVTLRRLIRKRARTCAAKACRTWATSSAR